MWFVLGINACGSTVSQWCSIIATSVQGSVMMASFSYFLHLPHLNISMVHLQEKVSVIVIDGVTIGHPCCGIHNCHTPLSSNCNHFCDHHNSNANICAIVDCSNTVTPDMITWGNPDHKAIEDVYHTWGQSRFQLQQHLECAWIAHLNNALGTPVANISELGDGEVLSVPHVFWSESVGTAQIPIRNSGSQYHPNSREFVQFVQPDSDRKGQSRSDHSELSPTNFWLEPCGSDWFWSERQSEEW